MAQLSSSEAAKYMANKVERFLDETNLIAISGGPIAWLESAKDTETRSWRASGFDNRLFPGGEIPLKVVLDNRNGDPVHDVAAKYYALAHRKGYV